VQEILDEWLKCQQGWLFLEPIFSSEDITQQLPAEARRFQAVDATWRRLMAVAVRSSDALQACSDDGLLKALMECTKLLEQVGCTEEHGTIKLPPGRVANQWLDATKQGNGMGGSQENVVNEPDKHPALRWLVVVVRPVYPTVSSYKWVSNRDHVSYSTCQIGPSPAPCMPEGSLEAWSLV
jgi:Dynein heavy chain, N-terminal region 2